MPPICNTAATTTQATVVAHAGDKKAGDGKTNNGTRSRQPVDCGFITNAERRAFWNRKPDGVVKLTRPSGYTGKRNKRVWSQDQLTVVTVNLPSPRLTRERGGVMKTDLEHYSDFTKRYMTIDPVYVPEKQGRSPLPRFCFTAEDRERGLAAAPVRSAAQRAVSFRTPASVSTSPNQINTPSPTGPTSARLAHPQTAQASRAPAWLTRWTTMTNIDISFIPITARVFTIKRRSGYGWQVSDEMKGKTLADALLFGAQRVKWKAVMKLAAQDAAKEGERRKWKAVMKQVAQNAAKMALACGLGLAGVAINTARGRRPGSPNLKRKREESGEEERPSKKRKTDDA